MCRAGEETEFFSGVQIFNEFRELDFEGASGNVRIFNETGIVPPVPFWLVISVPTCLLKEICYFLFNVLIFFVS